MALSFYPLKYELTVTYGYFNFDFNNLLMKNNFRLQAFINEAESLLNSSTLALEKFDLNKSTGYTPSVIGAQEVYR